MSLYLLHLLMCIVQVRNLCNKYKNLKKKCYINVMNEFITFSHMLKLNIFFDIQKGLVCLT